MTQASLIRAAASMRALALGQARATPNTRSPVLSTPARISRACGDSGMSPRLAGLCPSRPASSILPSVDLRPSQLSDLLAAGAGEDQELDHRRRRRRRRRRATP